MGSVRLCYNCNSYLHHIKIVQSSTGRVFPKKHKSDISGIFVEN